MLSDALLGMLVHIQEEDPADPLRKDNDTSLIFQCFYYLSSADETNNGKNNKEEYTQQTYQRFPFLL